MVMAVADAAYTTFGDVERNTVNGQSAWGRAAIHSDYPERFDSVRDLCNEFRNASGSVLIVCPDEGDSNRSFVAWSESASYFAERLADVKRRFGFSKADLAEILGISRQTVYLWEKNETAEPTASTKERMQRLMIAFEGLDAEKAQYLGKIFKRRLDPNCKVFHDVLTSSALDPVELKETVAKLGPLIDRTFASENLRLKSHQKKHSEPTRGLSKLG